MPLPHYNNLTGDAAPGGPGTLPYEPVYKNLFEITFILPTILQAQKLDPVIMLQNAKDVNIDVTPGIEIKTQRFKYSTRAYMGTPDKTHVEFGIDFQVNVNTGGTMETWQNLKNWYDIVWNSQNGSVSYKSDIIGTIIVNQHDKKGVVLRRVTFQNAQIKSLGGIELSWEGSGDIWDTKAEFVADYWIDETIQNNFVINPPLVSGY